MQLRKENHLAIARKKNGFGQKQIASLLGHKRTDQISCYERGEKLPSLKTALQLAIIYKLPLRVLFHHFYQESLNELASRAARLNQNSVLKIDLTEPTDYCAYMEMVKSPFISDIDKEKIRRHVKELMHERSQILPIH
jgi:transcriptional regulator with XRE-family HTH domain